MKHYVYDLLATGKLKDLELEFEKRFEVKAICCLTPDQLHMRVVMADYLFQFVGAFVFTDYDSYVWTGAPFGFRDLPKSEKKINSQEVVDFYFEFMKKSFKDYQEDLNNNI